MLLRAEGYSYREICELTGWTYTKVNRCSSRAARPFSVGWRRSRRGANASGTRRSIRPRRRGGRRRSGGRARAAPQDLLELPRALKEFRDAPARVAGLAPPAGLLAGQGDGLRGAAESALASIQQKVDSLMGMAQQRAASVGERAHAMAELATGQKLAAVAASAAAVAGGGTAIDQLPGPASPPPPPEGRSGEGRAREGRGGSGGDACARGRAAGHHAGAFAGAHAHPGAHARSGPAPTTTAPESGERVPARGRWRVHAHGIRAGRGRPGRSRTHKLGLRHPPEEAAVQGEEVQAASSRRDPGTRSLDRSGCSARYSTAIPTSRLSRGHTRLTLA